MPNTMHSFENNSSNVPAFLVKLWKLVEDPLCNDLIAWSENGASFIIKDQTKFSKDLLPQYFKHNNMASFIRQLNMYGFRKVLNYEKSGLRNESDEMEFQHPFFCKGQSPLLELIKRKISNNKVAVAEPALKSNPRDILTDLSSIREKQENMDNMLLKMKQENELLWRELTSMRQKHKAQEQIIQKVIQFLVSIVQQSNPNIGVQRKMARMLHDGTGSKGNSQVINVLRNKSPSFITGPQDKLVSPLGPVIHEVTDLEHEQEDNSILATVKSPEETTENDLHTEKIEEQEIDCPVSCLNSPIDTTTAMEPLSILEPLQPNTPIFNAVLNPEECNIEESVLGLPYDCILTSNNVISIPDNGSDNNVVSIPEMFNSGTLSKEDILYTTENPDFDDSESLKTPQIPTVQTEDNFSPIPLENKQTEVVQSHSEKENLSSVYNEHDYQIAVTEPSSLVKSSTLNKNTLSNHLLNVEEELNWLQDQITSNTWNIDANKLLGLFSADDVANNEALAGEIAGENNINIKIEPNDIIGNELVQFTPSMFEVDHDITHNPFLECLNQEPIPLSDATKPNEDEKNVLLADVVNNTDQLAASKAAEFLLRNGTTPKHKYPRRPKIAKLQKAKRRKLK